MRSVALTLLLLSVVGCRVPVAPSPMPAPETAAPATAAVPAVADPAAHDLLFAVLWTQTAAEYQALSRQVFSSAERALDEALGTPSQSAGVEQTAGFESLPPAVIVDIDETVLDNSPFEARLIREGGSFNPDLWAGWVSEASAEAVPGSVEFARHAADRGVTVFYVSNRDAPGEEATRRNLREKGFPLAEDVDVVLLRGERPEWSTSEKTSRRSSVAAHYRILLLLGDDLGDFVPNARVTRAERESIVERYDSWWGTRWFVLPNPMYGSWEGAITSGASPSERRQRLLDALRANR